jgi:hypothetical protein
MVIHAAQTTAAATEILTTTTSFENFWKGA